MLQSEITHGLHVGSLNQFLAQYMLVACMMLLVLQNHKAYYDNHVVMHDRDGLVV